MPPIRVKNKQTGKIDLIQWDHPVPPTPDNIRTIMSGGTILDPSQTQGYGHDIPEPAPMTSPNHGGNSWLNDAMNFGTDVVKGAASGAASTIYHGGDLIRRGVNAVAGPTEWKDFQTGGWDSTIVDQPDVQQAMTAPDTWGGKIGFLGEQIGEFAIPATKVSRAGQALSLPARLGLEGAIGGVTSGIQSGGDPRAMAIGVGAGIVAPPIINAAGRGISRLFGRGAAPGLTDDAAADVLLGKPKPTRPLSEVEAQEAMLGFPEGTGANTPLSSQWIPPGARRANQLPQYAGSPSEGVEGGSTLWGPPTQGSSRQLPSAAAATGRRFLGAEGRAPIDVASPIPSSAEAEVFAGSGQTAAAAKASGRPRPIRDASGRFRARTDEEALYLPREEGAPPFADLPPEGQAPYLDWLGRDEVIPPPPLPRETAGLSDTDYMSVLRERAATGPKVVRNPSTTRTTRSNVPRREYVGRPDYTPKVSSPNATPREVALDNLENSVIGAKTAEVAPTPTVGPPKTKPESIRRIENRLGRELTPDELSALGEETAKKETSWSRFGNEAGQVNPELARHLGGGVFGGAFGGMHGDTTEDRLKNAALGAALGFGASVAPTLGRSGGSRGTFKTGPITHAKPSLFSKMGRGRIKAEALDLANAPRAIMASVDLSAPLRQGATMIHRPEYWKALPSMVKAFASEDSFQALQREIQTRPSFDAMKSAKLALSDLTEKGGDAALREELFMSRAAERIPGLGRAIRASGRGYVAFLNKLRADSFDSLSAAAPKGTDSKALAKYINNATGRGDLGKFESSAKLLNATFFSPRLMSSRLQMMNPANYVAGDKFVRQQYLKSMLAFGGAVGTTLKLAQMNGAEVETDPRSSDFAKIKIGDTRLDIGAGFQQYVRTAAQVATGERKDLLTGKIKKLGKGYKDPTRKDVIANFLEAKASPILGFMIDMAEGKDFTGEKVQLLPEKFPPERKDYMKSQLGRRLSPMIIQDFYDLYDEDPSLLGLMVPAAFGASVQVHRPRVARHAQ